MSHLLSRLLRSARGRRRDDAGIATTTVAIVMPVVLLMVAAVVQAAIYYHGLQRAEAAADRAVATAAAQGGTADAGMAAAEDFLAGAPLDGASVTVERGTEDTTATVTGYAPQLIPGIDWQVSVQARAPTERFIAEDERS